MATGVVVAASAVLASATALTSTASGDVRGTWRASTGPGGVQADGGSSGAAISADGQHVAFVSDAANLVPGDTDGAADVFARNLRTGATRLVAPGYDPTISADGRYVAFSSWAADLVPGDTNDAGDIFVYDVLAGSLRRASLGADGGQADGPSFDAAISGDGRHVVFTSWATNLVPGDTNEFDDVFARDLRRGTTERVSVGAGGVQADRSDGYAWWSAVSKNGRYVAFTSFATNLVPGDTNGASDVFLRDRRGGVTTRVSVGTGGSQAIGGIRGFGSLRPAISDNGRFVAFESYAATGLVADTTRHLGETYVRDVREGRTQRVGVNSAGEQGDVVGTSMVSISGDGRYVAFMSAAGNLAAGDTNDAADVFLRDLRRGTTRRVSLGAGGGQGDDMSQTWRSALSRGARAVAFTSWATNLVPGDTNGAPDIYIRTPH
jgi:Tol biopolymer transport system component